MERVLITGVTGYIGSHLARALSKKYQVFGLAREPINMEYIGDVAERLTLLPCDGGYKSVAAAVAWARPQLVYHLATYYTGARGPEHVPKLIASNVALGAYLLEAMAQSGCRNLIYTDSVMTHYGGEPYCPLNLYAATKRAFSDLLTYYTDADILRAISLTLSDTYGPGDRRPKILNLILRAARTGEPLALSDGRQDYDVVYIDDVVRALALAGDRLLTGGSGGYYQVVPEQPLTLRETVEKLLEVSGLTADLRWGARPSPERDMRKAVRLYPTLSGWRAEVSLEDGLRRMAAQ